ncbi:hypothetical protein HNP29_003869 [Pseudomonas alcaligenes]|nr:hypothetical protein [Pseudomonas alcaligenes]
MAMPLELALRAVTIDELKEIGTFSEVRTLVQQELSVKLGARSWHGMLERMKRLHGLLSEMDSPLKTFAEHEPLADCRKALSATLELRVIATSIAALNTTVSRLNSLYCKKAFDPAARFEEIRLKNFISSSKLEGIEIHPASHTATLESIIAKYKRQSNG